VSCVSFSNLSYNLVLTSSGQVYEMGYSVLDDVANADQDLHNH